MNRGDSVRSMYEKRDRFYEKRLVRGADRTTCIGWFGADRSRRGVVSGADRSTATVGDGGILTDRLVF